MRYCVELKASFILIASLLFFSIWSFIPENYTYTYLFFDNSNWSFSLHPSEYRTYSLKIAFPHILQYAMGVMYIPLVRMLPKMRLGHIDLWWLWWLWELYKFTNQSLAFGQFPYVRYVFIFGLMVCQVLYVLNYEESDISFKKR